METKSATSLYSNPEAKAQILALYDEKLDSLNLETQSKFVESQFGKTHVIVAGNPENPPVVLLHGANAGASIALESMRPLVDNYCVYAIDLLGQPNKSAEKVIPMKGSDYATWLDDVLNLLNLNKVPVIGISLGGLVAWKTALHASSNLSKVILVVPAGIVSGNPLVGIGKIFYPMKRYTSTKKEKYLHQFLEVLFTDNDPYAIRSLGLIFSHFKMDFSPIPNIKDKEAQNIQTPIYLVGAEKDAFFPGEKLLKRAKKIFPSLQQSLLLADAKHVPGKTQEPEMHRFILEALKN